MTTPATKTERETTPEVTATTAAVTKLSSSKADTGAKGRMKPVSFELVVVVLDEELNVVLVPALVLEFVVVDVLEDEVVAVIEGMVEVRSVRVVEEVDVLTALVDVGVVDRLVTEVVVEVV